MTQIANRCGNISSLQGSQYSSIDVSTADFALANGEAFLVHNDSVYDTVEIQIRPLANATDAWETVHIGPLSEFPVLVTKVKQNANVSSLKYII